MNSVEKVAESIEAAGLMVLFGEEGALRGICRPAATESNSIRRNEGSSSSPTSRPTCGSVVQRTEYLASNQKGEVQLLSFPPDRGAGPIGDDTALARRKSRFKSVALHQR